MAYTIKGRVLQLLPKQHGTTKLGKNWEKQDLVITGIKFDPNNGQQVDDARNILKFSFFGDKINFLNGIAQGEFVTVHFDIQGKVFDSNGRQAYVTELLPYRIDRENAAVSNGMQHNGQGYQPMGGSTYSGYPGDTLGYPR